MRKSDDTSSTITGTYEKVSISPGESVASKNQEGIDVSVNGNTNITTDSITEDTTTFLPNGSVHVQQNTSIKVVTSTVEKPDVLTQVSPVEFSKMRNLLKTTVKDVDSQEDAGAHTGFYSSHKWKCYVRKCLAESEIPTEMHELVQFTNPICLENADIYRLFHGFVPGMFADMPKRKDIKF